MSSRDGEGERNRQVRAWNASPVRKAGAAARQAVRLRTGPMLRALRPRLPPLLQRTACLADRHLDAIGCSSWLVTLSGSAVLLGLVGFAGQIPVFLLAPSGGSLADTTAGTRSSLALRPRRWFWPWCWPA